MSVVLGGIGQTSCSSGLDWSRVSLLETLLAGTSGTECLQDRFSQECLYGRLRGQELVVLVKCVSGRHCWQEQVGLIKSVSRSGQDWTRVSL